MTDGLASARMEHLERELERSQRHTSLLMQIAQATAEPGGNEHLVRRSLEIIARTNGWVLGQFWIAMDQENVVRCSPWYFSTAHLPEFRAASADRRLSKGVGLPGRVWSTGLPLLLADLEAEAGLSFTRRSAALKAGLRSAFAFAIKNGPFVTGVFEFFNAEPIRADQTDNMFYEKLGVYIATALAQKDSERASRQQEELNSIVLGQAYNAFISINQASLITQWTTKATKLFGWEEEEVLGKPLQEIIIPERYRDAHMRGLFRYMTTKEGPVLNQRVRAPALHKRGHEIPIELVIFPIETLDLKRFGAFIVDCSKEGLEPAIKLE